MLENKTRRETGTVIKKGFGSGSKSEHEAYFLKTNEGKELVLRRRNANPFMDTFFEKYINKQIECKGVLEGYIFFVADNDVQVK